VLHCIDAADADTVIDRGVGGTAVDVILPDGKGGRHGYDGQRSIAVYTIILLLMDVTADGRVNDLRAPSEITAKLATNELTASDQSVDNLNDAVRHNQGSVVAVDACTSGAEFGVRWTTTVGMGDCKGWWHRQEWQAFVGLHGKRC